MPTLTNSLTNLLRAAGVLLAAAALAWPAALAQDDAPAAGPIVTTLILPQNIFEAGEPMRGELSLTNTSREWVDIADASKLVQALTLVTEDGTALAPQKTSLFGAAKTKSLGPGGFVGFAFDAAVLFPKLMEPGRYTLRFAPEGAPLREALVRVLPAFNPATDYWMTLTLPAGEIEIDLDERAAPQAVRHVVRVARLGHLDEASIARLQPGFAFKVSPEPNVARLTVPFEATTTPLLVGSVILEPVMTQSGPINSTNLIVLLGPQAGQQGKTTVIGQVVAGKTVLAAMERVATSGAEGSPPWTPAAPIVLSGARVVEKTR